MVPVYPTLIHISNIHRRHYKFISNLSECPLCLIRFLCAFEMPKCPFNLPSFALHKIQEEMVKFSENVETFESLFSFIQWEHWQKLHLNGWKYEFQQTKDKDLAKKDTTDVRLNQIWFILRYTEQRSLTKPCKR